MGNTLLGMTLWYLSSIPDFAAIVYCASGQTASDTTMGVSIVLVGGFYPILLTVAYVLKIVRSCFAP